MIELSQLDLQLAFVGACALGEDIEDKTGTVEHTALERTFEVALLARCQGVIEDDQIGLGGLDLVAQLFDLATTDKEFRSQATAGHAKESDHVGTCRHGQLPELLGIFARLGVLAFQMNQDGPLTALMTLEEQCSPLFRRYPARHRPARSHQHLAGAPDGWGRRWKWHVCRPSG